MKAMNVKPYSPPPGALPPPAPKKIPMVTTVINGNET